MAPASAPVDSPPPAPSPRSPLGGLFFRGAPDSPPEEFLPAMGEETSPASEPWPLPVEDELASAPEWTPDESTAQDESDPTSSPGSSGSRTVRLGKAAARATGAKAVLMAGSIAHRMAATTEGQRLAQLYVTDQEDAENIGHPLADIASRRGGVAGKALSPDANDALSALMGLANYATKQFALHVAAAQYDRQRSGAASPQPTPEGPAS